MSDEELESGSNDGVSTAGSTELKQSGKAVFAPSLFEQIDKLGYSSTEETETKKEAVTEYTEDDVRGFVEFPFDISSLLTRYKGFELTKEESDRLSKLFVKPFARTFGKVENMDWLMFGMAMVSISTEKILFFKEAIELKKRQATQAINSGGKNA